MCLGGGGALGFAHIGVLQALEERGIIPTHISGASMGAIIGSVYANGVSPREILQIVESYKMNKLLNIISLPYRSRKGLSDHKKVKAVLQQYIPHNSFDRLGIKFHLSVVDLYRGEWEIICSGDNLIDYILASMSIPVVFEPERIGQKLYVDGGLMNNLPVEPLIENKCCTVIAVDVQSAVEPVDHLKTSKRFINRCYNLVQKEMQKKRIALCDHYIAPPLDDYGIADFDQYKKIYNIGYRTMKDFLRKHPEIV